MAYWRAPEAKNTAAMVAIDVWQLRSGSDLDGLFLVCLDADNVLVPNHIQRIVDRLAEGAKYPWYKRLLINFKGDDCGVSGRDGYFASAFRDVRGYRQSLHSHGYQDSDLRGRLLQLCASEHAGSKDFEYSCQKLNGSGYSICNDPGGDERLAYSAAKLLHCPPEELKQFESWSKMLGANVKIANEEGEKIFVVNVSVDRLGCEYRNFVVHAPLRGTVAAGARVRTAAAVPCSKVPLPSGPPPPQLLAEACGARIQANAAQFGIPLDASSAYAAPLPVAPVAKKVAAPEIREVSLPPGPPTPQLLAAAAKAAARQHSGAPEFKVRLYTVGYSLALAALGPIVDNETWGAQEFRRDPYRAWKKGSYFDAAAQFVHIDCTDFRCPEANANHIGLHPEILLTFLGLSGRGDVRERNKGRVQRILADYAAALQRAVRHGRRKLDVVLWCSKGMHRSVGIAALLQGVHERFFGTEINVEHLNQPQWYLETCDCCHWLRGTALKSNICFIYVYMYVCMYICMDVCMYAHMMVCMCVCKYVCRREQDMCVCKYVCKKEQSKIHRAKEKDKEKVTGGQALSGRDTVPTVLG